MRLAFLGPPGAGKGTQAARAAAQRGIVHISTGDLLRESLQAGTPTGLKAKAYMEAGELVPDDIVVDMVGERLLQPDCDGGFILDGFPRNLAQTKALDKIPSVVERPLDAVIYFAVTDDVVVERIGGRRLCDACGANYHVTYMPSKTPEKCDRDGCNGSLYRRSDDQPGTVLERLRVYLEQTSELIDYYRERGVLHEVPADDDVDGVSVRLTDLLASFDSQT